MKRKFIVSLSFVGIFVLLGACGSTLQKVEVTRIVPQTVIATRLVTQEVTVNVIVTSQQTNTPILSSTITPTPKWTPAFTQTSLIILTLTPGLQVIDNNSRPNVEKFVSAQYIKDYLIMNYGYQSFGGKVFCGYQPIGIGNDGNTIKEYLWIKCLEYYLNNQKLEIGSAVSLPIVLSVEVRNGQYKIVDSKDSGGANQLVQTNFPLAIQRIILNRDVAPDMFNKGTIKISLSLQKEAEVYFER